jgi:hypothetical protein
LKKRENEALQAKRDKKLSKRAKVKKREQKLEKRVTAPIYRSFPTTIHFSFHIPRK